MEGNVNASLFVAVLPFGRYAFARACPNQKQASWIDAHVRMLHYFGGVAKILVLVNLKNLILT
jgi:transposase